MLQQSRSMLQRLQLQLRNTAATRGIAVVSAKLEGRDVSIAFDDGESRKIGAKWLRDHAPENLHASSKQRMFDTFTVRSDVVIQDVAVEDKGEAISFTFPDQRVQFDASWLRKNGPGTLLPSASLFRPDTTIWGSDVITSHPDVNVDYDNVVHREDGREMILERLWNYGLVIVKHTPPSMKITRIVAEHIGAIKNTMFGMMWATRPQQQKVYEVHEYSDTAATNDALLPHTDGNYWRDAPGVQVFNCVQQSAEGGESVYVDGYKVIQDIANQVPEGYTETALSFFSRVPIRFYLIDPQGYHFEAVATIIRQDLKNRVVQLRHNDYDRSALSHLSNEECHAFYAYHDILTKAIRDPKNQLLVKLNPGDMTIIDNHRVLHGRTAFRGERNMIGCYIGKDDIDSAFRVCLNRSYE